uniref:Retroviral polymerase SH3-like domain-containing protein n=1 Tax=Lactuca sativa TaxID=4236 RepID=A0A9R1W5P1_LACSA|nr:hypothetical protein LSAT_V11C300153740 [Lactuca sativa]
MYPQCSVSNSEPEDQSKSSTSHESSMHHEPHDNVACEHTINDIPCSKTKTRNIKSNNQSSLYFHLERNQNLILKERIWESKLVIDVVMLFTRLASAPLKKNCFLDMIGFKSLLEDIINKDSLTLHMEIIARELQRDMDPSSVILLFSKMSLIIISFQSANRVTLAMKFSLTRKNERLLIKGLMASMLWISVLMTTLFVAVSSLIIVFESQEHIKDLGEAVGKRNAQDWEVLYDHKVRQLRSDHAPIWKTSTQTQGFLRTSMRLELSNKMVFQREEIELSLKLEELWTLKLDEPVNTACYTQNRSIIVKRHRKTTYELLKGRNLDISYFHLFGCVCYILNQRDKCLNFEAKVDEGVFLGYSSISKVFKVFNLSWQTFDETAHVTFEEDSFIRDRVDHPSSILNELTYSPLDQVLEFFPSVVEPVVPNFDQLISSQPISEVRLPSLKKLNHQIRKNLLKILTCSRVCKNFYMFVNLVSMIEPKNVIDALKEADWIKATQSDMNEFERHRVWALVPKH